MLDRKGNQIVRVKNGEYLDMLKGDDKRRKAISMLLEQFVGKNNASFDYDFTLIANWLIDELVETLQTETHGTSFVISFKAKGEDILSHKPDDEKDINSWRSNIEMQTKTLVGDFSHLEAPLATWEQLKNDAENALKKDGTYKRPAHLFNFLAELANLDGGLWLTLSKDGEKDGLTVRAAQQFIPLLKEKDCVRPLDLHMDFKDPLLENLPQLITAPVEKFCQLKSLLSAIKGNKEFNAMSTEQKNYIGKLSFLHHSGTKTHSLWGLSLTAIELCICVVLSTDGNTYVFHDGREFIRPLPE